jgi:polar amino acid transport system substrate-binding protein
LRKKLEGAGVRLEVEFLPWARSKKVAQGDGYVGYCPAWPEEVDPGFFASVPIGYSEVAVIAGRGDVRFSTLEEVFKSLRVGLVESYVYPKEIQRLAKVHSQNVSFVQDEDILAKMLYRGRFDVVLTDPAVVRFVAGKLGLSAPVVLSVVERKPLVLALKNNENGKRQAELLGRIWGKE